MSSGYKFANVCRNGHCISDFLNTPEIKEHYCEVCGAETIVRCLNCAEPIRGKYNAPGVLDLTPFHVPKYCRVCGKPYPWTESAIETASAIILEDAELDESQSEALISSLPDIMAETPRTKLAVIRMKKALMAVGKFTAEGLRDFAIDFGCELAKRQLGL